MFPFGGLLVSNPPNDISLPSTASAFDFGIWPGTVTAGISVTRAGILQRLEGGSSFQLGANYWMESTGRTATVGDLYEVRALFVSGDALYVGSDLTNTWLQINTIRQWYIQSASKFVFHDTNITIQVREIANPSNITNLCAVDLHIEQEL